MSLKLFNGAKLYSSHLEEEWMLYYVNRHPLLEMKVEATYSTKDDPVPSQNQDVPRLNPKT
jgi:hypothetical protein